MRFNDKTPAGRRRLMESTASFGLILVCVALLVPFFNPENMSLVAVFKWVYAAGALIFTVARVVNTSDPTDSVRMKRLRRLEFWAGIAFVIAAAFWFYEENRLASLGPYIGVLAILRNTILFSLVGAAIQIIASWLIVAQSRKEKTSHKESPKR